MLLRKKHLAGWSFGRSPVANPPAQCPHLPITEPTRLRLLQMLEDRLGLYPWFNGEQLLNLIPAIGERIRPCAPRMLLSHLAGQAPISQVPASRLRVHTRFRRRNL